MFSQNFIKMVLYINKNYSPLKLKNCKGETLVVLSGAGKISGLTLRLLNQLKDNDICILYIKPNKEDMSQQAMLRHRATMGVLQQYARSDVFKRMYVIDNEVVDTLMIARDKFPGSPASLDALCKRFRIDNSKRTQHSALVDCDLLFKVYVNLIDQKEPTLDFKYEEKDKINFNLKNISYDKKIIVPTEDEISNHKQYIKSNFKKSFFN